MADKLYPYEYTYAEKKAIALIEEGAFNKDCEYEMPVFSLEDQIRYAQSWDRWNPLFNDIDYARSAGYKSIPAIPGFVEPIVRIMPSKEFGTPIALNYAFPGDGYDHEVHYYRPIYANEHLHVRITTNNVVDITPPQGEKFRALIIENHIKVLDEKEDTVATAILRWPEFFSPQSIEKNNNHPHASFRYEHSPHCYSADDWNLIKDIWTHERIRGAETLYYEDVIVGESIPWTTEGPITAMDMIRLHGHFVVGAEPIREFLLSNEEDFLVYDEASGVYYYQNYSHFVPHFGRRPQFFNTTGRNLFVRAVTNWCGDSGFVSKLAWRLINSLPPERQANRFPAEFHRPSYLLSVPYLKNENRYMNQHGLVMDCVISKGYIAKKYVESGKGYVDLVCWGEDLDNNIIAEGLVTVALPLKTALAKGVYNEKK